MMFAQLPTISGAEFGGWMVGLAAAVALANQIFKFKKNAVGEPPSGEMKVTIEALREQVRRLEHEVSEADTRRKAIYSEIGKVRVELTQNIRHVQDKIEDMPSRVIALLRNTGVIK